MRSEAHLTSRRHIPSPGCFSEPRQDGRWGWRPNRVAELLARDRSQPLFFAGCSQEQAALPFEHRILLTAPPPVLVERLRRRTTNPYGAGPAERRGPQGDDPRDRARGDRGEAEAAPGGVAGARASSHEGVPHVYILDIYYLFGMPSRINN